MKACDAGSCGLPAELPEREIGEQKARHRGVFDDILGAAHDDGGNAIGLQMPRDQADGLVAYRTVRDQHRGIDLVGPAACENLGRIGLDGDAMAAVGRRAEETRSDFADPSQARQPEQLRQRKPGSAVLGRGVHAIIGDVGNPQVVRLRGVTVIDRIELGAAIVCARRGPDRLLRDRYGAAVVMMVTRDRSSGCFSGWNGAST